MMLGYQKKQEQGLGSALNCGVREMNPSALLTQFSHLPFPVLLLELMEMDFCNRAVKCQLVSFGPSFNGIS